MADPLGRKHQIQRIPKNRWQVDKVCQYVMDKERRNFTKKPTATHIFFDAYAVVYGQEEAFKMLNTIRSDI
jgi:hypothetical protein